MNKKLALFFLDDALHAAVQPFEGKFEHWRKKGYPLYFVSHEGEASFGDYQEAYWKGDGNILGDFYGLVLAEETYEEFGYEKAYIELLNPILDDIRKNYYQIFSKIGDTSVSKKTKIPLALCFSEQIPAAAREKIVAYLAAYGFDMGNATANLNPSPAEFLAFLKLREGVFTPPNHYGIVEALGQDLVMSIFRITSEVDVEKVDTVIHEGYGVDMRIGAMARFALEEVHRNFHVLTNEVDFQQEYNAQLFNASLWNRKLVHSSLPYITVDVKLSTKSGFSTSCTFEKEKIDRMTANRSRYLGMLFSRLAKRHKIEPAKIILLGDNLLNDHITDGFNRYGEDNILPLGSRHLADILHSMLLGLPSSSDPPTIQKIVESKNLSPGDKVFMKWGEPIREVTALYEGSNSFMVVESRNAQIVKGDRFETSIFVLNQKAVLNNIFSTSQNRRLGRKYYSSRPLSFLRLEKVK